MNYAGKGEIAEEDGESHSHCRRATVKNESESGSCSDRDSDSKPKACIRAANGGSVKEQKQQSPGSTHGKDEMLGDDDVKINSSSSMKEILGPRSISPSPLSLLGVAPTCTTRFKKSNLAKAMKRSNDTRSFIQNLRKRIFDRLEQEQTVAQLDVKYSSNSQSICDIEDGENQPSSVVRQKRRFECLQNTKAMMSQSLPPSMMPFVEETLRAAHFFHRRRQENGHGRIIHKILVEQHKQVLKELEHNGNTKSDTSHSSGSNSNELS